MKAYPHYFFLFIVDYANIFSLGSLCLHYTSEERHTTQALYTRMVDLEYIDNPKFTMSLTKAAAGSEIVRRTGTLYNRSHTTTLEDLADVLRRDILDHTSRITPQKEENNNKILLRNKILCSELAP